MKKLFIKCDGCKSENILNFSESRTEFYCQKCSKLIYTTNRQISCATKDNRGCLICGKEHEPSVVLKNGREVHAMCFFNLEKELEELQKQENQIKYYILQLKQKLDLVQKNISRLMRKSNPNIILKMFLNQRNRQIEYSRHVEHSFTSCRTVSRSEATLGLPSLKKCST